MKQKIVLDNLSPMPSSTINETRSSSQKIAKAAKVLKRSSSPSWGPSIQKMSSYVVFVVASETTAGELARSKLCLKQLIKIEQNATLIDQKST
jgi:hypothetical protein